MIIDYRFYCFTIIGIFCWLYINPKTYIKKVLCDHIEVLNWSINYNLSSHQSIYKIYERGVVYSCKTTKFNKCFCQVEHKS